MISAPTKLNTPGKDTPKITHPITRVPTAVANLTALRRQLLTACAWTNRIKVGEQWMTLHDFLERFLDIRVTHGISPQAAAAMLCEYEEEANRSALDRAAL